MGALVVEPVYPVQGLDLDVLDVAPVSLTPALSPGPDGVLEGVQDEFGGHRCGGSPAHDPAGEDREFGCYLELDMFGYQSGYEPEVDFTYPADGERVSALVRIVELGMADRLLLSHDNIFKTTLMTYGGHGFGYIHRVIKPRLERRGVDADTLDQGLVRNAQSVLPLRIPEPPE
ncbi:phosphotriesterase family protein [Nocardioides luteus]|uniref:phosphotriesterase family protein n=1 Tax=Nocardioides luteus TaxID=1844 RepID=UPI0018CB5ABC|nr:hypothetical protein [Nocardioides luteus]MBG6095817.1 hypothetical protein [Nocardioides luteus]